jgi:hypothetical protein
LPGRNGSSFTGLTQPANFSSPKVNPCEILASENEKSGSGEYFLQKRPVEALELEVAGDSFRELALKDDDPGLKDQKSIWLGESWSIFILKLDPPG